jgi:hypothetical protein
MDWETDNSYKNSIIEISYLSLLLTNTQLKCVSL